MNPCEPDPCQNGGRCGRLTGAKFFCDCPDTHQGEICEDEGIVFESPGMSYRAWSYLFANVDCVLI